MERETAIIRVSVIGLESANPQDVIDAAIEVWYSPQLPTFDTLDPSQLRTFGYLLDRLSRFHCVAKSRKQQLQNLIEPLRHNIAMAPATSGAIKVDELAVQWELGVDLSQFIKELLPYQTRHYASFARHTFS